MQEGQQRYRRQKTSKSRVHEDEAWVHWQYSPEEWTLFEKVDWDTQRFLLWGLAGCCAALVIAAILPWFILSPATDAGPLLSMFLPALLGWCMLFPFTMAYLFSYIDARKRHMARQQESRTVTFSREGVWDIFSPR